MDIRFFNTFNHVAPLLDYLLPRLNEKGVHATAYISQSRYRKSNKGDDHIIYFEKSKLTGISKSRKRINQIVYALSASQKVLFSRAKLNVFFTQPPLYPIIGSWLSRLRGVPYGIHIMDHYPGLVGALGYLEEQGWLYRWLDKRMDKALQNAEFVTVLGSCMKQLVMDKGVAESRIKQVINVPTIKDEPLTVDYLDKINLKEKFTVIYAGNMGIAHEFRTVLSVAERMGESHPEIHFIMLGKGHRKKEVLEYVERKKPKNMTMVGYLENEEFTAIMKQTDLHLITMRDDFNGLLVPSKLYSSLALGKPVLFEGPATCEIAVVLEKYKAGTRVKHLDVEAMEAAILSYKEDEKKLISEGRNAKKYFEKKCRIEKFIADYADFLTTQLQGKA